MKNNIDEQGTETFMLHSEPPQKTKSSGYVPPLRSGPLAALRFGFLVGL